MIAMSAMQGWMQYQQASAQADAIEDQHEARQDQISQRAAARARDRAERGRRERARLTAMQAERGVAGHSVNQQHRVSRVNQSRDIGMIEVNQDIQSQAAHTQAQGQMNQVPTSGEILFNTGLSIGNTMYGEYGVDPQTTGGRRRRNPNVNTGAGG